jgi:hypothetical protein
LRRRFAGWTPWNFLQPRDGDDSSNEEEQDVSTWFQIQCSSPSVKGDSITTLKVESRLEDVLDSCRFGLQHEQAVVESIFNHNKQE